MIFHDEPQGTEPAREIAAGETWANVTRRIAAEHGLNLTNEEVDFALWERSPWPMGGKQHVEAALHRWFASVADGDPLGDGLDEESS